MRLAFSSIIVGAVRTALTVLILGSTIFQFVQPWSFEGWFINLWFIVVCFELQLLVVQFDFIVESRRSLLLSTVGEGGPLMSGSHRGPGFASP